VKKQLDVQRQFFKLVNMSPKAIRAWAKDGRSKCASFASTRARLPKLAALKSKPRSRWTAADFTYAARVVSFNSRMKGVVKKHGCTTRAVTSLLNWGHKAACPMPPKTCKRK